MKLAILLMKPKQNKIYFGYNANKVEQIENKKFYVLKVCSINLEESEKIFIFYHSFGALNGY